MHVFQLESKTAFLRPPLYSFNAFSRQLQDTKIGSQSCAANKNIRSCYGKDLKEHPRGRKGQKTSRPGHTQSEAGGRNKVPVWQVVLQGLSATSVSEKLWGTVCTSGARLPLLLTSQALLCV